MTGDIAQATESACVGCGLALVRVLSIQKLAQVERFLGRCRVVISWRYRQLSGAAFALILLFGKRFARGCFFGRNRRLCVVAQVFGWPIVDMAASR